MPFKEGVFIYSLLVFGMVCSWGSLSKTRIYRKDTLSYSIRLWRSVTVPKNPVQNYFTCDISIFSKYLSISWQLQHNQILYNSQISADSFTSFVQDRCFLSNEVFKASDFDFQTCLSTDDRQDLPLNYKLRVAFYRRVVKVVKTCSFHPILSASAKFNW